jgi:hypothetical protein
MTDEPKVLSITKIPERFYLFYLYLYLYSLFTLELYSYVHSQLLTASRPINQPVQRPIGLDPEPSSLPQGYPAQ